MRELVEMGINKSSTVKTHLDAMVRKELFSSKNLPPPTDRKFWPSMKDISNHVHMATVQMRGSNVDQENVDVLIESLTQNNPQDQFHFRPHRGEYIEKNDTNLHHCDAKLHKLHRSTNLHVKNGIYTP